MDKNGRIVYYIIFSFIALVLFLPLVSFVWGSYDDLKTELDIDSSTSFLMTTNSNETLSPLSPTGEEIEDVVVVRQNSTWLNFDGVDDYLFIEDNSYVSVSFWVNDSNNDWTHIVNSSGVIYEDNTTVGSLTLNPFKRNNTGWYFGINESGYFNGSIDTIKFYNDTMTEGQVSDIFDDGK